MTPIELILQQWMNEYVIHSHSIKDRIKFLAAEALDEEDQDEPMSEASLRDALQVLNSRPSLTLSPMGEISASWIICDHKLVVRFLGDGKISGILLKNN
jgi:hypothetical protein